MSQKGFGGGGGAQSLRGSEATKPEEVYATERGEGGVTDPPLPR